MNIINSVYIERDSLNSKVAKNLLSYFDRKKVFVVEKIEKEKINGNKWNIVCKRWGGNFLKDCPCTPIYRGCDYKVLNLVHNCYLSCSYCILQSYLGGKTIWVFSDYENVFYEIDSFLSDRKNSIYRFGTGELSDSLFLDKILGISKDLINFFKNKKNGILELKTKTVEIDHLLGEKHNGRTVFAWSLNPEDIAIGEEKYSPSPILRIKAAKRAVDHGFFVAFHFDPVIFYEGWEDGYDRLIKLLGNTIPSESVVWISVGSLRFMPDLLDFVDVEFPESKIFYSEFKRGLDGKMRYFLPLRKKMYSFVVRNLKEYFRDVPIYFCMESDDMWEDVIGFRPKSDSDVREYIVSKIERSGFQVGKR